MNTENIKIRTAGPEDIDLLVTWRMEVLHEVFSVPPEQPLKELEQNNRLYYRTALTEGEHIACFACTGEEIIGCGGICIYREMPSVDNISGKCAYLMNIYTRKQYRRQGTGKMIVTWLKNQALEQGITKIYLETSMAGKSLYLKTGFADMPDMMKLVSV